MPTTRCSNLTTFSDGAGFLNSRFSLADDDDKEECHYLETCCDPENIISQNESRAQIQGRANEDTMEQCIQQCKATDNPILTKLPPRFHTITQEPISGCGFRNKNGVGVEILLNSSIAQFGEFPWHLALSERKDSDFSYICGASLIHPQVALTGAHCVNGKQSSKLRVRAGEWDTKTVNEPFPHSDHGVAKFVIHPDFGVSNLMNDVALVILESPVKLSAHINTICLPPSNLKFDDKTCFASGWGAENFQDPNAYRVNLKKLELPVVQLRECQQRLRQTKLGDKFKIHTSFMCAGGEEGIDTCVGKRLITYL